MAYQCTQPSLPPPIHGQQGSSGAQEPSTCASSCTTASADCGSPAYQMTQACLPPPIFMQPRPTECANAPAPPFVPMCHAVIADPGPTARPEVSSSSGGPCTEQPCLPLVEVVRPATAGIVDPNMARYSHANAEASPAPCPEATPAYVTPGSVVSLHPSGRITVRPGPVGEASVSMGASMPHIS
ncbi:PREDICTED: unconventional myosin-XVI-like [Gekko japonicus]|uniref:Unconventional myosin-XVI-like n=1 Tax=Gekko japonicus TaxID=146911 RepID=A0ABM1KYU2_GEKJA|nr:PREDICTED: unconventional myosin-XVI-like [Gekko japonicus]